MLSPDYTEDAVSMALSIQLTLLSFPDQRFSIEPFSHAKERWIGTDAKLADDLSGFLPFYMQFKRPHGYLARSRGSIVKDRAALKLTTAPDVLCFALHPARSSDSDFQHNILFRLNQRLTSRKLGNAAYVCPLFLDRSIYISRNHMAGLMALLGPHAASPFKLRRTIVWDAQSSAPFPFEKVPFFANHVTVLPHEQVGESGHRYSFTRRGRQLCFHSDPTPLPEGSESLAAYLAFLGSRALLEEHLVRPDTSKALLDYISGADQNFQSLERGHGTIGGGGSAAAVKGSRTRQPSDVVERMGSLDFEMFVAEAFRLQGYMVSGPASAEHDRSFDLMLRKDRETFLVQCKQVNGSNVGAQVVRELSAVVRALGATSGFVVTSGTFTQEAIALANEANVRLFDGSKLLELRRQLDGPHVGQDPASWLSGWMRWGDHLQSQWGIEQFAFVRRKHSPKDEQTLQ